ncbi:MAG TPA: bifunctional metallophosphatase/5'-nucleotidase, partial [Deinococcales bacterium]|nr:bifunctional metallophosphatase/5'-nucleotidase [Deinococcales bacterium]
MTGRAKRSGRITLIQQNDIHGQVSEHWERFWNGGTDDYRRAGGAARAAAVVKGIRAEGRAALFIDSGDAIHGTLPAMRSEGSAIVPVLNALKLDAMTPGNWDYGFGPAVLRERLAGMRFPVLAANLQDAESGEPILPAYAIAEAGGLRVGLLGLTSPIVPSMAARFAAGLRFPDARAALSRFTRALRQEEDVDLTVLVSHLGFPQDVTLAREAGGIDVILSGHTHNRLERPALAGGARIIQSGFSGSFLGLLELEVERGQVIDARHRLVPLDENVAPDPEVAEAAAAAEAPWREEMNEIVGRTAVPLHRYGLLETTMDNLITGAYRALTGADVALSHGWRFAPPVPSGDVRAADLWTMVPTNPEVVTATARGEQLLALLEENLQAVLAGDPLQQAGGYLLRAAGLRVAFRPNNPNGTRVEQVEVAGRPLDPGREYTIATAGTRDLPPGAEATGTGTRAIDAIRRHLARGEARPAL